MKLLSDRGHELFFCAAGGGQVPVITVENCIKWLESMFISDYGESAYGDHVFNPRFVLFLAAGLGMDVDEIALEVIIGRWQQEHCNVDFSVPAPSVAVRRDAVAESHSTALLACLDTLMRLTDRVDMVLRGVAEQTELFGLVDEAKEVLKANATAHLRAGREAGGS